MTTSPLLIATRKRAGKEKFLITAVDLGSILFVEPEDLFVYEKYYPHARLININEEAQGLSYVRQFILDWAVQNGVKSYWMLDDDIKGFYRREGTKMVKEENWLMMLNEAEDMFRQNGVWHGGFEYQQFAWSATKPLIFNSFCDNVVWVDVEKCKNIKYDMRLKLKVDRDFCMSVIAAGGKTARTTLHAFATPPDGSNAGGLKEVCYDIEGLEASSVDVLAEKWGSGVVTKFQKPTGRWDAKINWKMINQPRQNTVNDFFNLGI